MKKNLLTILSVIITSAVAIAQPTLTATGINPVLGDSYTLKYGPGVNPGSAGSNQNWSVMPVSTSTTIVYNTTSVASTPYAASFTQANISYNGGGNYIFYNTSSSILKNQGAQAGTTTLSYSDPEDFLHYPFNMGNSYSDTWAVNFTSGGFAFARTGTTTVTYDGYGTLTLPSGTYGSAARVHFVQVYSDVYSGGTINYNNDEYMWYINGNHQPVAVTYTATNSVGSPAAYSVILSNIVSSVHDYEPIFSMISTFPNPAVNEVNFDFNGVPMSSVEIIDITGKKIHTQSLSKDNIENYMTVNTSEFKEGIYFARFTTQDGQTGSKKISISK
ncbi:MAG: T9SS type A sorting domain-containing protein [Bacteroidota bacterium]